MFYSNIILKNIFYTTYVQLFDIENFLICCIGLCINELPKFDNS